MVSTLSSKEAKKQETNRNKVAFVYIRQKSAVHVLEAVIHGRLLQASQTVLPLMYLVASVSRIPWERLLHFFLAIQPTVLQPCGAMHVLEDVQYFRDAPATASSTLPARNKDIKTIQAPKIRISPTSPTHAYATPISHLRDVSKY